MCKGKGSDLSKIQRLEQKVERLEEEENAHEEQVKQFEAQKKQLEDKGITDPDWERAARKLFQDKKAQLARNRAAYSAKLDAFEFVFTNVQKEGAELAEECPEEKCDESKGPYKGKDCNSKGQRNQGKDAKGNKGKDSDKGKEHECKGSGCDNGKGPYKSKDCDEGSGGPPPPPPTPPPPPPPPWEVRPPWIHEKLEEEEEEESNKVRCAVEKSAASVPKPPKGMPLVHSLIPRPPPGRPPPLKKKKKKCHEGEDADQGIASKKKLCKALEHRSRSRPYNQSIGADDAEEAEYLGAEDISEEAEDDEDPLTTGSPLQPASPPPPWQRGGGAQVIHYYFKMQQEMQTGAQHENLSKIPKKYVPCRYFKANNGACRFGENCDFSHDPKIQTLAVEEWPRGLCKTFTMNGYCRRGETCYYIHDGEPGLEKRFTKDEARRDKERKCTPMEEDLPEDLPPWKRMKKN